MRGIARFGFWQNAPPDTDNRIGGQNQHIRLRGSVFQKHKALFRKRRRGELCGQFFVLRVSSISAGTIVSGTMPTCANNA